MTREQHLETLIAHTRAQVEETNATNARLRAMIDTTNKQIAALTRIKGG